MSEPRVPPGPARVRLARAAGLRPRSPWLVPSALCLALAAALPSLGAGLARAMRAGLDGRQHDLEVMVFETGSIGLVGVVVIAVAVIAASGGLGWVRRVKLGRVGEIAGSPGWLGVLVLLALVLALRGVVAGAARSVDASPVGLVALWCEWPRRALTAIGCAGLVAAVIELARGRAELRRALRQTPAEARESRA